MKALVFYEQNRLKPTGGPCGYLFNLKKGLEDNPSISFLSGHEPKSPKFKKLKIPHFVVRYLKDLIWRRRTKRLLKAEISVGGIALDDYDIVHFHTTADLYKFRHAVENYKGKILLTSHCPKAPYLEIMEDMISKRELKSKFF